MCVLEGGYHLPSLGDSVVASLEVGVEVCVGALVWIPELPLTFTRGQLCVYVCVEGEGSVVIQSTTRHGLGTALWYHWKFVWVGWKVGKVGKVGVETRWAGGAVV